MSAEAWIAVLGLGFVVLVQAGGTIWWAATMSGRVKQLEKDSSAHGDLRDIVIEMRTEMRGFRESIKELADALKARPSRARVAE